MPPFLQVTLASPTICNCLFHIFGLSMLSNDVKETAVTMALNIRKKKKNMAPNELAKHRNQVCKTRHSEKFASLKLVQLAPRSFCYKSVWTMAAAGFALDLVSNVKPAQLARLAWLQDKQICCYMVAGTELEKHATGHEMSNQQS